MTDEGVVTDAELAEAEARIAARKALIDEMDRLVAARNEANADATIRLRVAIDFECASGLRRKTRTGHDVSPSRPRDALQNVDKALAAWYAVGEERQSAIDAKIAEVEQANPQYRKDMNLVERWIKQQHS